MLAVNRGQTKLLLAFFIVLFSSIAVAQQATPREQKGDGVWIWSKQCSSGNRKLRVTVRLRNKVLYRGVIAVCVGSRDAEDGRVEFKFAGGHVFQGEYRTRSTDSVQGDIWQAGGEPDALILGISFATDKQVLLNTLHIARPDRRTSSQLDRGLFITTDPVAVR